MRRLLISLIFVLITCLTQSSEARKLALLVGVDEYANVSSLKCCVNDMNTLKEALQKVGFDESDIQVLKTGSASIRELPTRENIERKIAEILADARSSDVIFLAFSGHGMREDETDYFCPPFADPEDIKGTCVSITKVMDDLARSKARLKWMVVDACRSESTNSRDARAFQVIPKAPAGIVLFQSCAKGQKSYEEERVGGNGYFTKNFAEALSGAADQNHDGQLTLMEVCDWTIDQTEAEVERKENKTQRPYLKGELTKFILTKDLNVPKAKALAAEAEKAMEAEDYALAIEKFDAALALCPKFDQWKREQDLAKKFLKQEKRIKNEEKRRKEAEQKARETAKMTTKPVESSLPVSSGQKEKHNISKPDNKTPFSEVLNKLDEQINQAQNITEMAELHAKRADLLENMARNASSPEDRSQWIHALADGVTGSIQQGVYPDGIDRLKKLLESLKENEEDKALAAYVQFRLMCSEYMLSMMQNSGTATAWLQVRTKWLEDLQAFIKAYPDEPDTAEAMLQIGIVKEDDGAEDKAKDLYIQIITKFPDSDSAEKAKGALVRLTCEGKPLTYAVRVLGQEEKQVNIAKLRGKVVVLHFWASWMSDAVREFDQLKALQAKYPKELLLLGVNLDDEAATAQKFVADNHVQWYQLFEKGGMESRPANALGIFNVPTIMVIGADGNVISNYVTSDEMEKVVANAISQIK